MSEPRSPTPKDAEQIRQTVREGYSEVARSRSSCCGGGASDAQLRKAAEQVGYDTADLDAIPDEANLGVGCGNPTAIASLRAGEVVVDLGAGAGIDALIAARKVGPEGRVIGVDMTPDMLERARANAVKMGVARTVEFREGLIENMPVVSNSADVVISNCVINLSPDKPQVFREIFRILKPGGRIAISDICLSAPLPADLAHLAGAYVACIAGAALEDDYVTAIRAAGFAEVEVTSKPAGDLVEVLVNDSTLRPAIQAIGVDRVRDAAASVRSVSVQAKKPPS